MCQFLQKEKNLATLQVIYVENTTEILQIHTISFYNLLSKIICIVTRNNFVSSEVRDLLLLQNISIVLWHGQSQTLNPF